MRLLFALCLLALVDSRPDALHSSRHGRQCPPLDRGAFNITQYQLYPENADWDEDRCLVWFGALWNASVAVYDPYKDKMVDILEFPGITNSIPEHIGGVSWDKHTGLVSILVDAATPWATNGQDISGDNLLIKYDPSKRQILWNVNLTATSQGRYGAFQDVEHDYHGNTYVVGTYPGTIMKVNPSGKKVTPWYLPPRINYTQKGFSGLAVVENILLSNDADGQIYRFDMRKAHGVPVLVRMSPLVTYQGTDAIYLPPKYGGTVLLVAINRSGVQVVRSKDRKWAACEYLGTIPNPDTPATSGSVTTGVVQMGSDSIYMIDDWTDLPFVPGQAAGNRTVFPMVDITENIERLLAK
ncbi:hypothetical protein GE09DRAFT_978903 [Coniochaeta sp. 2T2.1]|nr:hypothetical protein GE09DRAFT_978903 [Coniochaeta sp. 2T2.1]